MHQNHSPWWTWWDLEILRSWVVSHGVSWRCTCAESSRALRIWGAYGDLLADALPTQQLQGVTLWNVRNLKPRNYFCILTTQFWKKQHTGLHLLHAHVVNIEEWPGIFWSVFEVFYKGRLKLGKKSNSTGRRQGKVFCNQLNELSNARLQLLKDMSDLLVLRSSLTSRVNSAPSCGFALMVYFIHWDYFWLDVFMFFSFFCVSLFGLSFMGFLCFVSTSFVLLLCRRKEMKESLKETSFVKVK